MAVRLRARAGGKLVAVHAGHVQVDQAGVGAEGLGQQERGGPVVAGPRLVAEEGEHVGGGVGDVVVVVDAQDARRRSAGVVDSITRGGGPPRDYP